MEKATSLDLQSRPQKIGMLLAASSQPSQYACMGREHVRYFSMNLGPKDRHVPNVSLEIREYCWFPWIEGK